MNIDVGRIPIRRLPPGGARRSAPPGPLLSRRARERIGVLIVLVLALYAGSHATTSLAGGVSGALGLWLLLRHPRLALPGMVFVMGTVPLEINTGTGSGINTAIAGLGLLGVLFVLRMLVDRNIALRPTAANVPWMALILSGFVSLVASAALWNPWVVVKDNFIWVQMGQMGVFVLSATAFWLVGNSHYGRDELLRILYAFYLLVALKLVAWFVPGAGLVGRLLNWDGPTWRIWVVALSLSLALFHEGLTRERRLVLAAVVPVVLLGPLLISQFVAWEYQAWASGWVPATVALLTILAVWLYDRFKWGAIGLYVYGTCAAIVVFFQLLAASAEERYSLDTRAIAWRGLVQLLRGNWLLGLGPASYWHYWKGVFGTISYLDPRTGYLHYTNEPTVNMHNNYLDILGQMGVVGVVILLWLFIALLRTALRLFRTERNGFGRAYVVACIGALTGMAAAGMLGDWFLPFVYNIGFRGFKDSYLGWLLLGGLTLLDHTRGAVPVAADAQPPPGGGWTSVGRGGMALRDGPRHIHEEGQQH